MTFSANWRIVNSPGLPEIYRPGKTGFGIHETQEAFDQIVDVAERSCLLAFAKNRDRIALQGLHDKVRYDPAIVGMHTRAVGVENTCDFDVQTMLAVIIEKQCFGAAFAFVVAGTNADRIHVAPIGFGLRMHGRVAVNFAGGCLEYAAAKTLRQAEHIDCTVHGGLCCLYGVVLVMHRGCRTGEIVDFVHFEIERKSDIVPYEFETRISRANVRCCVCCR